jgi:hypothetical protein
MTEGQGQPIGDRARLMIATTPHRDVCVEICCR